MEINTLVHWSSSVDSNLRGISEAFGQREHSRPLVEWYWREEPRYIQVFLQKGFIDWLLGLMGFEGARGLH